MKKMTKAGEEKLISHVHKVIDEVSNGQNPTGALAKVAEAAELSREEIRRVGEAYNQSKTLDHLAKTAGASRLKNFNLANIDSAINSIYKEQYKTAGVQHAEAITADSYKDGIPDFVAEINRQGKLQKFAELFSASEPAKEVAKAPNISNIEKVDNKSADRFRMFSKLSSDVRSRQSEYQTQLIKVGEQLSQSFYDYPFEKVEVDLHKRFGERIAKSASDLLWKLTNAEKLGQKRASKKALDYSNDPFFSFGNSFGTVESLVQNALELQKNARELKKEREALKPDPQPVVEKKASIFDKYTGEDGPDFTKAAFLPQPLGLTRYVAGTGMGALDRMRAQPSADDQALLEAVDSMEDPRLKDELKQIRVQAMINDFMSNDEVISSYDPEEVIDSFNELSQLNPYIIDKPGVMRDWIRRALQEGGIGAFDAGSVMEQSKAEQDRYSKMHLSDQYKNLLTDPKALMQSNIKSEIAQKNRPLFNTSVLSRKSDFDEKANSPTNHSKQPNKPQDNN